MFLYTGIDNTSTVKGLRYQVCPRVYVLLYTWAISNILFLEMCFMFVVVMFVVVVFRCNLCCVMIDLELSENP